MSMRVEKVFTSTNSLQSKKSFNKAEFFFINFVSSFITDKRVENWFLMQGYTPTLIITAIYVLFVTKIGPKFMENREPYKLKWPIVIYNFICIAINFHICTEVWFSYNYVIVSMVEIFFRFFS